MASIVYEDENQVKQTTNSTTVQSDLDPIEAQQLMIAIREFQKSLKPILSFTSALKSFKTLKEIYSDNLAPLVKKANENPAAAQLIGEYINITNSNECGNAIASLSNVIDRMGSYVDFIPNGQAVVDEKPICNKAVEIKIKERVLPKFTTLEYN